VENPTCYLAERKVVMNRNPRRGCSITTILLATVFCTLCNVQACRNVGEFEEAELPQTPAGRCAADYFKAFNSEGDDVLRTFVAEYRTPAFLEEHPVEERVTRLIRLRGIFGALTPARVTLSFDYQVTLLVVPENTGDVLVMRFQLEETQPHKLSFITITGIDKLDVPDEYVGYAATRAVPVTTELRASTVESIAQAFRDVYIYPELGRRMADTLMYRQGRGEYQDLKKAGTLADRLREDAVAVSGDLHIWVEAQNPMVQASTDPLNRDIDELRRDKFDFREARVLTGNIGYIKFDMIHDEEEAQQIVAEGLAGLADCEALILDLRDNIGGAWGTAGLFLGYVLPAGEILTRVYNRDGDLVEERAVPSEIPGEPFAASVPVYVLTSENTGSAAEALAYTLKHTGRATIVGEVTRGAAHPSEELVINDYFRVSIPFLRSENVQTKTDWERVGVIPDIDVPASDALETAIESARKRVGNRD
jgi:hypothetical protein